MRCNNCGWNNPSHVHFCQKCNQSLDTAEPEEVFHEEYASNKDVRATTVVHLENDEEENATIPVTEKKHIAPSEIAGTVVMSSPIEASQPKTSGTTAEANASKALKATVAINVAESEPAPQFEKNKNTPQRTPLQSPLKGTVIDEKIPTVQFEETSNVVAAHNLRRKEESESEKNRNYKRTMPDDSLFKSIMAKEEAREAESKKSYDVELRAMDLEKDEKELPTITISSTVSIGLKKGDVVFIANRRWQV